MPNVNLKFEGDNLVPEDDDISTSYLLGRQVAHEYHSSAVQSYISAEAAAQQAAAQAAMDEQDEFRKEQSKKQAEGKAAASSFADTQQTTQPAREGELQPAHGQAAPAELAPAHTTAQTQAEVGKETQGIEDPMIDPTMAATAGMGGAFKLSMSAGKALMPSLARAVSAGVINAVTDPIYGTGAEVVGATHPALAVPFNLAVGLLGGMTLEPAIERGIIKAATAAGKKLDPAMIAEQVQVMKGILANEAGSIGKDIKKADFVSAEQNLRDVVFTTLGRKSSVEYGISKIINEHISDFEPGMVIDELKVFKNDPEMIVDQLKAEFGNSKKLVRDGIVEEKFDKWVSDRVPEAKAAIDEKITQYRSGLNNLKSKYGVKLNEAGEVDDLTKSAVIEEINAEIGKHPVSDALRILKSQKGEITIRTGKATPDLKSEPGYVYHATNFENANEISEGKLKTHKAHEFTDQDAWPDGATEKRSYWSRRADVVWQFAPEHGESVILRAKEDVRFKTESTGDVYTKIPIHSKELEILGADGKWHPLNDSAVKKAAKIIKDQRGSTTMLPGSGPMPPAQVKGGKGGVPAATDMEAKAGEFTANKAPDITQERAGNIRLWGADLEPKFMGEIETPEDIMRVIKGTDDVFETEREIARGGTQSWAKTEEMANKGGIEDILGRKLGQALPADQILRARKFLASSAQTLVGMSQIVRSGQANDLQKADFMRAFNVHYAIQMQLSGAAAEAGRALNIFRKVAQSDELRVGQLRDFMAATADKKITPESIADALSTCTSPAQVSKMVDKTRRATTWDMFIEGWINGLLSGPVTHSVNTTSNMLVSMWMVPERALASGLSKLHGGDIRGGEVAAQTYGLVQGAKDGFNAAWQVIKTGQGSDIMGKLEQQEFRSITAENVRQLPAIKKLSPNALQEGGWAARFVDGLGEFVRIPGRLLTAEDEFFKSIGYRMELQAQAFRKAAGEGLDGKDMAKRIQEILADPENLAPEVHLAAIDASRYQTFTKDLGKGGKGLQSFANNVPGAKLVIPFIRTPTNILKFALERNFITAPFFKQVRADILAGGPRMDMALSRIAMGSAAMGVVASYAAAGYITGGGPSDQALRSHKYNTGWQPYSIKIVDKYYAYGRLEPLGMMMGLAADAVEIMGELDEMESDKIATTIVAAIGKNVMSKTWLRGMSEMINAMDDPDRYGSKYVKQFAGTAVPSAVAQVERTMYPELSDAQTALDAIKARTPGFSKDLPARRNLWGEKIQFNGALGPDIISPIFTSEKKSSPIDDELIRMKAPIRMPSRNQTFEGVTIKLDANEYEEFMVRMNSMKLDSTGKTLKKSLNELVTKDKDYKALQNDDQKERNIKAYIQEATEKTRAEMLESNSTLRLLVDDEHRRQAAAR